MTKTKILTISLITVALAVITFFCADVQKSNDVKEMPDDTATPAALTVSEVTVTEGQWPAMIKATGPVAAWQEAVVGAEVSGQKIVAVMSDVGNVVKKGQILAKFNSETLKAEYAEFKANWIAAESNQSRALALKGSGAISNQAVEDFVNRAAVAKAQMDAKTLQLKYADVVSPDDGVISVRNATLGAVGSFGDELFRLIRQNRLEWRGELTADQAARVDRGQSVAITLPNGDTAKGVIRQVAPSFNPETRMTTIYVDIKKGSSAQAGMYAEGHILLGKKTAFIVPAKSIVIRDGHNYVFIIRNDNSVTRVNQREVQVGQIRGAEVQILSGILKGNRIVLQGAGFLNDGDIVLVSPEKGG